jgi:hypothetical protein
MLEHEWHSLEQLCDRISTLRDREAHAVRSKNVGLLAGSKQDIAEAGRQRQQLVRHISARLSAVSAHTPGAGDAAAHTSTNEG